MATTSLQQNLRQKMVSHWVRATGPGILVIVLTLVFVVGISVAQPWYITHDLEGSALRQDVGKVAGLYYQHKQSIPTITVEVNGIRAPLQTSVPVRIGEQVQVTYRVGKSGTIYVQRIASLSGN